MTIKTRKLKKEEINRNKKNNLIGDVDSFKNNIPTITVPTAPIAVQQAQAIPNGIDLSEYSKRTKLKIKNITVRADGIIFVNDCEYLSIIAHSTSQIPPSIKYIHELILITHKI